MKHVFCLLMVVSLIVLSSQAFAQYGESPFIEGYVGGNYSVPTGFIKNDLNPSSLNADGGFGLNAGAGLHINPKIIVGVFYSNLNMSAAGVDLSHHLFEVGAFGKYMFMDITETKVVPYVKGGIGLSFDKFASKVNDGSEIKLRELQYNPTLGLDGALGVQLRTDSHGGLYLEGAYHYNMSDNITGTYHGTDYTWLGNTQLFVIRAGVNFNIGRKE